MNETVQDPRHPIQVVARRTGLTPDVIRVWERRYSAVSPSRSESRRRLYSDEDVRRLVLLRKATLAGRRIGDVANMSDDELVELVASDERSTAEAPTVAPTPSAGPRPVPDDAVLRHQKACLLAVEKLDGTAMDGALNQARLELSTPVLIDRVLMPVLHEVGDRWRSGSIRPYQEHLATSMIKSLLESLRPFHAKPTSGPEFLVTTPAGQVHEMGALMAAVIAATEGWRVTYLGPNLPAEEIAAAALQRKARVIGLSVVYPPDDPLLEQELRRLRQLLPSEVEIVVGGRAASNYVPVLDSIGAIQVATFDTLRSELIRIRNA